MESAAGGKLIDRRGNRLTTLGEDISAVAARMQREVHAAERRLRANRSPEGWVRLSVNELVATHVLAPRWSGLREALPRVSLDIDSSYQLSNLSTNDADVVVRIASTAPDDAIARRVCGFAVAAYGSRTYLANADPESAPKDCSWIGWEDSLPYPREFKAEMYPDVPVVWKFRSRLQQLEATRAGFGIAALPCIAADHIPNLVRLTQPRIVGSVFAMRHMDHRNASTIRAVFDFCVDAVADQAARLEGVVHEDQRGGAEHTP